MRILIAEDDAFFQKLLQQILAHDHEIIIANNGNEAWEMLQRPDAPRLAILDWVMPGLSGPQVCRKVRECSSMSSMYLIILTAKNNEADIVSGLRAGADDYITKPPISAELQARVRVGERILALQETVKEQSILANQASGREHLLRKSHAASLPTRSSHGEEAKPEAEPSRQLREHGKSRLDFRPEADNPKLHLLMDRLEKSHLRH